MKKNQTLFVDFETGNEEFIKRLIEAAKAEKFLADIAEIERTYTDENACAVLGYAFNYGFYGIPRDFKRSDEFLAKGIARGSTSSYFISGIIQIDRGDRDEGIRLVEQAAQRDYPPALYMLGVNNLNGKWKSSDQKLGHKSLLRVSEFSYIPAKIFLYHKQSQAPYPKWVRLKSIFGLAVSLGVTKVLASILPLSKSLSYFKNL